MAKLASKHDMDEIYLRAVESLKLGRIDSALEADLDSLDALARRELKCGLYPGSSRAYTPSLAAANTGARWWTCPHGLCAGQGRVRPDQTTPPSCAATAQPLEAGPLPQ